MKHKELELEKQQEQIEGLTPLEWVIGKTVLQYFDEGIDKALGFNK